MVWQEFVLYQKGDRSNPIARNIAPLRTDYRTLQHGSIQIALIGGGRKYPWDMSSASANQEP